MTAGRTPASSRRPMESQKNACRAAAALLAAALLAVEPAAADSIPITLLHTTDLHGRVGGLLGADRGSLLQLAALVRAVRAEQPNVLLIDNGDTLQGGPESTRSRGALTLRAMRLMNYDAWVVGNHEFDWGWPVLARRIPEAAESGIAVLAANLRPRPGTSPPRPAIQPFAVFERGGLRVAVVGLTNPALPSWFLDESLGPWAAGDSIEALRRTMPAVRAAQPHILVLAAHQGLSPGGDGPTSQIRRIARLFPEFDVLIGGHTHDTAGEIRLGRVLYAQAGCHAESLGRVDLVYDTDRQALVHREARRIAVDGTAPDPGLAAALADDLAAVRRTLKSVVAQVDRTFPPMAADRGGRDVAGLLRAAIAEAAGTPVVVHGALSASELRAGLVREDDLWFLVPYDNRIGVLRLVPEELRAVLDEAAGYRGTHHFMDVSGLQVAWRFSAPPGARIENLRGADGHPLDPAARIPVAFNSYVLASGGGRYPALRRLADDPACGLTWAGQETRDALRAYLKKHYPVRDRTP